MSMRQDGKSLDVDLTTTVAKGEVLQDGDGFVGITLAAGSSGDTVAIEIAQRVHEINVGASITAARGDTLYIDSNGDISNTDTDTPFAKVTLAKNSDNYCWVLLLPQQA